MYVKFFCITFVYMKTLTIIYRENILNSALEIIKKGCSQVLYLTGEQLNQDINALIREISKDTHIRYTLI